jgi:polyferredoxin
LKPGTSRIGPKRTLVQWFCSLLVLGLPFIKLGGDSLLRLDAATRTLLFFGARIRIEEFYLFLLLVLIFVFGFLFVTFLLGRVWCGWLCPQTTLCDLADWLDARVRNAVVRQLLYLLIACVVACNLIWYFVAPSEFFGRLFAGHVGAVAGISWISMFLLVYLDLALVRRKFCKTVCPYGRVQLMTTGSGTLTLEFDQKLKDACLRCGACVRACPMEIDIRNGLQIECINCGRCLDACREVMEKTGGKGLIRYSFGSGTYSISPKAKFVALAGVLVLLTAMLVVAIVTRTEASLKVQRVPTAAVKVLPDGTLVNFFTLYLENRGTSRARYSIEPVAVDGYQVELVGPVRDIELAPNENTKVTVVAKVLPAPRERIEVPVRLVRQGKVVATASLPIVRE